MPQIQASIDKMRMRELESLNRIVSLQSKDITEHGAGNGFISHVLSSTFESKVVAYDPAPRHPQFSPVFVGALQTTPADTEVVLTFHVLEHVPSHDWRNLVPNGFVGNDEKVGVHVVPTVFCSLLTTALAPFAYFRNFFLNTRALLSALQVRPLPMRLILRHMERLLPYNVVRWRGHGTCATPLHELFAWRRSTYAKNIAKAGFTAAIHPLDVVYSMHRLFPNRFKVLRTAAARCGLKSSMVIVLRNTRGPSLSKCSQA